MNDNLRDTLTQLLEACEKAGVPGPFLLEDVLSNAFHSTDEEMREIRDFVTSWKGGQIGRV